VADGVELVKVRPQRAVVLLAIVVLDRLTRDGRGAVHRQPIDDLWIRLAEVDAEGLRVEDFDALQRRRVVKGAAILRRRVVRLLHPHDVLREVREERGLDLRIAKPLEGVMHIARDDLPPFAAGEARIVVIPRHGLEPAPVADLPIG
jgi:hypothetical protein